MQQNDNVEELRRIAEYHTAVRTLRVLGWNGVVFGIINIYLGMNNALRLHPINAALAMIGVLLLTSGVWCLVLPRAEGIILNGIDLILVGLWNFFVTSLNFMGNGWLQIWWAVFGGIQIAAAVQLFKKYARSSAALRQGASPEERAMMNELVSTILKSNSGDQQIVTFHVKGFSQLKIWRGQLGQNAAVFVEKTSREVLVAQKDEVNIERRGKLLLGETLKASIKIRDHKWESLISPAAFNRLVDWKMDEEHLESEPDIKANNVRDESLGGIKE